MYRVVWRKNAREQLADCWLAAADRDAVTRASHAPEQRLTHDPRDAGEDRPGGSRVAFESPLDARYEIVEDDRKVIIGAVWLY